MSFNTTAIRRTMHRGLRPIYDGVRRHLPLSARRRLEHVVRHRRLLHLKNPRTYNEKLAWRLVYDRRELLKPTCDKKAMKELAQRRAGNLVNIPKTFWTGLDLAQLAEIQLPEHWVLKPNHRSGLVYVGRGKPNVGELKNITAGWLDEVNWSELGEWAYKHAEPTFIVEEFIGKPGEIPTDYKFEVFAGTVRMVAVYVGRFQKMRGYLYNSNFVPLNVKYAIDLQYDDEIIDPPSNFEQMIEVAEKIADGFDYLRVDLYSVAGKVWFGEVTPYSANGGAAFAPTSFDLELGSHWTLPDL